MNLIKVYLLAFLICWSWSPIAWAGGQHPQGDLLKAQAAFYQGNYSIAQQEYEKCLKRLSDPQSVVQDQVMVLLEAQRYQDAIDLMLKAKINGRLLGEVYLAGGQKKQAIKALKYELSQPGSHYRTRLLLGWLAAQSNQHHQAINLFWQVVQEKPKLSYAHLLMAQSFHSLANQSVTEREYFLKRAKEEYKQAKKYDASLWQAHRGLATMYEDQQSWKSALTQWRKVRSVVGKTKEVETAFDQLRQHLPTPTITATPGVIIRTAKIKPAKIKSYHVEPLSQQDDPTIKVGLGRSLSTLSFACVGPWRAIDHNGRNFWKGVENRGYRIKRLVNGQWYLTSWEGEKLKRIRKSLTIKPLNPAKVLVLLNHYHNTGYFWSGSVKNSSYYRGRFKVKFKKRKLSVINHVQLEDYLLSVVPGEMPALWPKEALKTQAVVARTDTLMRRGTHRKYGYDVCNTAHCAVYHGVSVEHKRTNDAVASTAGEVLTKENKLIPTFYSHACGGLTQSFKEAWRKKITNFSHGQGIIDINNNTQTALVTLPLSPYQLNTWIISEPDVNCNNMTYAGHHSFRWLKIVDRFELSQLVDRKYKLGELQAIRIKERGPSGYVRYIEFIGSHKNKVIGRDRIRSALGGLRSNLFQLQPLKSDRKKSAPDAWIISGGGWGHGVGFCQAGAGAMGAKNHGYEIILKHYFPDSELIVWTK